jgi:protein SCO1/2
LKNSVLGGLVVILLVAFIWLTFFFKPEGQGTALVEAPLGGDFTLHSTDGPVSLADLRGKVVVLYFGYTWCPDICPTGLGVLTMALNELGPDELSKLQVLFVSVDPERDTLERLKTYVGYFHDSMLGVTGSTAEIDKVVSLYGGAYRKVDEGNSAMGYLMDHSASLYLIGKDGKLAKTLIHGTKPQVILADLRELIQ